jgi:hypothetical protein
MAESSAIRYNFDVLSKKAKSRNTELYSRVSSEYIEHQDRVESVDELQQFAEADDTQICSGETYQITSAMVASNISVESRLSFNMNYMDTVEPSRQSEDLPIGICIIGDTESVLIYR